MNYNIIPTCLLLTLLLQPLAGCAPSAASSATTTPMAAGQRAADALLLATTTSIADTGLLDAILPVFEQANGCTVDYVAVGTGQAIEIGRRRDADALLVHDRPAEEQFVADGFAKARFDVMYNDFVIVGPKEDPAGIGGVGTAKDAFKAIMAAAVPFASRGDRSGTHARELAIWASLGVTPTKELRWYNALGQGMGDTLLFANEQSAYALTDRGAYLAMRGKLPNLTILVGGATLADNPDKSLLNPYGILAVNREKFPSANAALADKFVAWLLSAETQKMIGEFGVDRFGQPLFYASKAHE